MLWEKLRKNHEKNTSAQSPIPWDRASRKPVIRSSICTGEKVAGFRDLATNKFEDIMLIRDQKDLDAFMRQYGIAPEEIGKEW